MLFTEKTIINRGEGRRRDGGGRMKRGQGRKEEQREGGRD